MVQLLEQRTLLTNFQWDVFLDQVGGAQASGWSVGIYDLVRTTREIVFEGYVPPVNGVFNSQAAVVSDVTTEKHISDAFIVSANTPLELQNTVHRSYTNRGILPDYIYTSVTHSFSFRHLVPTGSGLWSGGFASGINGLTFAKVTVGGSVFGQPVNDQIEVPGRDYRSSVVVKFELPEAEVSGILFDDLNGNGVREIDEPGLPDRFVSIHGEGFQSVETNESGAFTLRRSSGLTSEGVGSLQPNPMTLSVIDRLSGEKFTTQNQVGLVHDSTLHKDFGHADIGLFKNTTVSGHVYVDHNGNGHKDPEDEPKSSVRVFLDRNGDGALTDADQPVEFENPVTTDENGNYTLNYEFSANSLVRPAIRAISPGIPASLFSITQGGSAGYSALSGVPLTGADFGVFQTATIEGFVFNDVNGNGKFEHPTDTFAGRVKLQLDIGNNGTIDDSYIVGDSGQYQFRAPPGAYRVFLAAPVTGQKQTAPASAAGHVGVVTQDSQRIKGLLFGVQLGKDVGIASATFDGTKFKVDFSATAAITTPFNIGFYQSDDAKFSASDRRFGQLLSVTPPDSGQGTAEFTIPLVYVFDKTKPFILVVADPDGRIVELTETNNTLTATRIIDVSPLKIVGGNFQYDRLTDSFKATGDIAIGFKPATGEPFFPLVHVEGDVTYGAKTIHSDGVVTATVGDFTSTLFAGEWDLRFADATTTLLKPNPNPIASVTNFALAGFGLKFHSLKLVNPGGPLTTDSYLEITGTLKPPLTSIDIEFTADHVLKLTSTGPVVDRRIALPKFKFDVFGMKVEAEGLSLEYFHPRRAFRLQGKVSLDNVLKILGGDLAQKIAADFSEQNYLEWNQTGFVAIGSIAVEKIVIIPDRIELRNVKISFNTLNQEWRGEAEIKLPILPGNTTLLAGVGFRNAELNFISVGADHLNIPLPIPSGKPIVLQKVQAQLDNLVDVDPYSTEFGLSVGLSDTFELVLPVTEPNSIFDLLTGPFFRVDLTGKISQNHIVGAIDGFVANKDLLSFSGQAELDFHEAHNPGSAYHSDWDRFAIKVKGSFDALKGVVKGQFDASYSTDLSTPEGARTFIAAGSATIKFRESQKEKIKEKLPAWIASRLVDRELTGKVNLNLIGDGNDKNDYLLVYFDSDLPFFGRQTLGFRLGFDGDFGSFQPLTNMLAVTSAAIAPPPAAAETSSLLASSSAVASGRANEFMIPPATNQVILAASWTNDVGPVSLEVVAPDGTVIPEASFAPGQIVVLEEFSTSRTRVIGLSAPTTGLWRVQLASSEDVGEIIYEASINTVAPTIEVTNVTLDGATATIDYSAADSDSDATVHFFYDTDNSGFDGVPILNPVTESDSSGSVTWDTSLLPAGTYHVYAMIDDGNNAPVFAYAETPVVIEDLPTSISGVVFEDSDASGVREDGEQPLANWIVFLDANNNGVLDNPVSGDNVADENATEVWTPSNTNGEYSFASVTLGVHVLAVVNQAGFAPTFAADGEPLLVVLTEDNPQRLIDLGSDRIPPVITSLSQTAVIAGSVTTPNVLTLTIRGTGFLAGSPTPLQTVEINTPGDPDNFVARTTIIDSPTQMRVLIPADQIATSRTAQVRINHADVGLSNVFDLLVSSNVVSISSTSASKLEGNAETAPFTFTVTRTGDTTGSATLDYVVSGSGVNAATTDDFNGLFPIGTVTFAPGQTSQVITIDVSGDTDVELAETFDVRLTNAVGTAIANSNATGTITNDDTSFTIAGVSASKLEGNTGSTPFTFTVTRNGMTTGTGSVKFAVTGSGVNPAAAADFGSAFPTGMVSFLANETSKTITVNAKAETLFEADEAFAVTLNTPLGGVLGATASATATILNDDTAVVIAATNASKPEGTSANPTPFTFTITRLGNLNVTSSVKYAVAANGSGASAAAATDFVGGKFPSGSETFAPGEATRLITIPVIADATLEGNEGFKVTLSSPTGTNLGAIIVANGTIQNDDSVVAIAATSASKSEGNSSTTPFTFTATRTGDTSGVSSVIYTVTGASANGANATDFGGTFPSNTVEFTAGQASKLVTINVSGDTLGELNEGFVVTLSSPTNAILGTASANGTITNDDTSFSITPVSVTSANKAEGSSTSNPPSKTAFTFTVTRIGISAAGSVQFAVAGSGGNPADASDFANAMFPTGTLTFTAAQTSQTVTVNVLGDTAVEANEGFTVTLSNPTGAITLANPTASGTINTDDTTFAIVATDASKNEGNTGTTPFTFVITRAGVTTGTASVNLVVTGTAGPNAANGADFGMTFGTNFGTAFPHATALFAAHQTTVIVTINVKGDIAVEQNEGFTVTLSKPSSGATIVTLSALGTIINDD